MANLKKNLIYNFGLSISQVLIPFVSIPYIARVLDPEGIGRVGFIDSLTYYFITLAEFGIVVHAIREVAKARHDPQQMRKTVSELLTLHLITSALAIVLYSIAVWACWQKIQDTRLLLFSGCFLLVNCFACEWYFWGQERFRYITLRSLATRLLGLAAVFVFVRQPEDYFLYYGAIAGAAIANLLWNSFTIFREVPVRFRGVEWKKHLPSTGIIFLINIVSSIPLFLDNVLLGMVSTTAAIGIYAFSIKFVRIGSALLTDSFLVLYPRTVTLLQANDHAAVQQTVLKSVQGVLLLSIPAGMGIYLLAEPMVQVLLGNKFQAVAGNLQWIAALPLLKAYSVLLSKQVLIPHNREKLFLRSLMAGALLFVPSTLFLSARYHHTGACMAIMLAELAILGINYYYAQKTAPSLVLFHAPTVLQALAGSLLFIPVVHLIRNNVDAPLLVILMAVLICLPLYFLCQLVILRNTFIRSLYKGGWAFLKA